VDGHADGHRNRYGYAPAANGHENSHSDLHPVADSHRDIHTAANSYQNANHAAPSSTNSD
jgi:hypothetical protein